jgi:hypothetical protein
MRAGAGRAVRGCGALAFALALGAGAARAESCRDAVKAPERAKVERTTYLFETPGRAVDAAGIVWRNVGHHAIRLRGKDSACWSGGTIIGPFPEDAVYECKLAHGWRGGGPCMGFHTTAGIAPEVAAPETLIEDVRVSDYGDGISLEALSGPVLVRRAYLHDLHDDAVENDFGARVTVEDSLIERAYIAFASRPRSSTRLDQRQKVFTVRRNLVLLHRFTNAYKQKPGHGGVFKWPEDGTGPRFAVTDNVFVLDDPGAGQLAVPLTNQVEDCRNNRLLWAGSRADYRAWLADGGGLSDGRRNNSARLAALARCYDVVVKPADQTKAAFLAEHWDPLVAEWKRTHAAGREPEPQPGRAPAPQAPAGSGSVSTGSSSSSQSSR